MMTPEEKAKRDELVKQRPCKKCLHYRGDQYISCGFKCDFSHSGFKKAKPEKEYKYSVIRK